MPRFPDRCRGLPVLALLALSGCGAEPPSVVLVTVDTLRADAVGFMGDASARTPVLDALARSGTVFDRAMTPIPRTTPGVGSLLTGLWPHHHGSREVGNPLREVETLAMILGRRGYATLGVSSNPAAGRLQRVDRGFERWLDPSDLAGGATGVRGGKPGWATTEGALALLDDLDRTTPFFLWVLYFDPHFPYLPPSPWAEGVRAPACRALYRELAAGLPLGGVFADLEGAASRAVADCRDLYAAEVTYVDSEIGRLLAAVRGRRPEGPEPLVVVTADHGENLGEGGLFFEHGDNAHDAGLHVPLVFSGPGIASGRRDAGAVSLVDVPPTLLSLLELGEESAGMDGIDLSRRMASGEPPREGPRTVFAESASALWNQAFGRLTTGRLGARNCLNGARYTLCRVAGEPGVDRLHDRERDPRLSTDVAAEHPAETARLARAWERWPPESARDRAAMRGSFKLLARPRLEGGYALTLHDLESDPGEVRDVRGAHPEVFEDLARDLEAWAAELPTGSETLLDPEIVEALRSLGYLE